MLKIAVILKKGELKQFKLDLVSGNFQHFVFSFFFFFFFGVSDMESAPLGAVRLTELSSSLRFFSEFFSFFPSSTESPSTAGFSSSVKKKT